MFPKQKRYAAIIGINNYQDGNIARLYGAVNDAAEMRQVLEHEGGFTIEHYLVDADASSGKIRRALGDLLWRVTPADFALFYFSGHGFADKYGNGYLAPWDMDKEQPVAYGIRMSHVQEMMLQSINKNVVLAIVDACMSGIMAQGEKGMVDSVPIHTTIPSMVRDAPESRGRFYFTSSAPDQLSREREACQHSIGETSGDHWHGAFTFELLEGLQWGAAHGDDVRLPDLHAFVEDRMADLPEKQQPNWASGGLQDYHELVVVHASRNTQLQTAISEADGLVAMGDVFGAVAALKQQYAIAPNHHGVKQLVSSIDAKCEVPKRTLQRVFLQYMRPIVTKAPTTLKRANDLLFRLSFAQLASDDSLCNLLATVYEDEQSATPREEREKAMWLAHMFAALEQEPTLKNAASAPSQAPRRRGRARG